MKKKFINLEKINRYQVWIWLIFFSFAYEKPIFIISSLDKINPRLFDLLLLIGFFITLKKRSVYNNRIFKQWAMIIIWFTFVTLVGASLFPFPWDIKQFMFYFLFEYYKELLAIFILLKIPKTYYSINTIISAIIIGGIFVASYCVIELNVGIEDVIISDIKTISKPPGMVWGPYIGSYFEIAVYIPLAFSFSLAMLIYSKGINKIWLALITLFIAWPILFTGSRTAIFLALLSAAIIVIQSLKRSIWTLLILGFFLTIAIALTGKFDLFFNSDQNETLNRIESLEESDSNDAVDDSILSRVLLFKDFNIDNYDVKEALPVLGAGFYVAPTEGGYRIGYGIHNIYLFPVEQAGVIGIILFVMFIFVSIRILKNGLKELDKNSQLFWFVSAVYAYFIASLLIGISGHTFWRGFTTYNFNTLRILLLVVSSMIIENHEKNTIS